MRIDNALGTQAQLTGSFTGSFIGQLDGTFSTQTGNIVSGAFAQDSSSFSTRITDLEAFEQNVYTTYATDYELGLVEGRLSNLEADNLISSSAQIASDISGSLSIAHINAKVPGLLSSSAQIASDISGSFNSLSESIALRFDSDESSLSSLNAATSSYLLNTTDTLTGDLTVTGTITAQEFHTQYVSASIIFKSGSTVFGNSYDDVHNFSGSLVINSGATPTTGSLVYQGGSLTISGDDADLNLNITSGSGIANLAEIRFRVDNGTIGRLYMHKSTQHMYIGPEATDTSSLYLRDGTGIAMTISGSSVGIGTTSPSDKLSVYTSTDFGNNSTYDDATIGFGNGAYPVSIKSYRYGGSYLNGLDFYYNDGTPQLGMRINSSGNLGVGTSTPGEKLTVNGAIGIQYDGTQTWHITGDSDNGIRFVRSGIADRVVIDSDGRVGISTTLPSTDLDINGSIQADNINLGRGSVASFGSGVPTLRLQGTSQNGRAGAIWFKNYDGNDVAALYVTDDTADDYGTTLCAYSGSIRFATQTLPAEKMIIAPDGNVGIGTTSTSADLEVFTDAGGGNTLRLNTNFGGGNSVDINPYISGVNNGGMEIKLAGSQKLVMNPSGYVGINTTTPSTQLEILYPSYIGKDTSQGLIRLVGQSNDEYAGDQLSAGTAIEFYNRWQGGAAYSVARIAGRGSTSYDGGLQFDVAQNTGPGQSNFVNAITILKTGNVGIGTTSPSEKLTIFGGDMALRGDTYSTIELHTTSGTNFAISNRYTANRLSIDAIGTGELVNILSNGSVGINSTSPVYKLDVVGNGRFTEQLKVDQPVVGWSDSGTKHYTHLATFSGYGSAASALIINTNIPGHNQSGNGNMFSFRIVGYAYGSLGLIDMMVGCYAGEGNFYAAWWTGTCQTNWIDNVYVYTNSSGKVAFQIGETTDTLAAEIAITDFVQGFANVNTSYADSWSCQAVTTLPTQNQKTNVPYKAIAPDIYEDVTFHGSVGIGTSSPINKLQVGSTFTIDESLGAKYVANLGSPDTGGTQTVPKEIAFFTNSSNAAREERMRIDSTGNVLVGKQTFDVDLNGFSIQAANDFAVYSSMGSPYNTYHVYNTLDNRYDFYVSYDGDVYARNTTIQSLSDERLKENIQDLTGSLDVITSLRPRVFDFKDGSKINSKGFVAQEVEQVLPECVKEFTAGEPLEDGTRYKTVGQDFMPYIVGAIQELKAENDSLKARIQALESQ